MWILEVHNSAYNREQREGRSSSDVYFEIQLINQWIWWPANLCSDRSSFFFISEEKNMPLSLKRMLLLKGLANIVFLWWIPPNVGVTWGKRTGKSGQIEKPLLGCSNKTRRFRKQRLKPRKATSYWLIWKFWCGFFDINAPESQASLL